MRTARSGSLRPHSPDCRARPACRSPDIYHRRAPRRVRGLEHPDRTADRVHPPSRLSSRHQCCWRGSCATSPFSPRRSASTRPFTRCVRLEGERAPGRPPAGVTVLQVPGMIPRRAAGAVPRRRLAVALGHIRRRSTPSTSSSPTPIRRMLNNLVFVQLQVPPVPAPASVLDCSRCRGRAISYFGEALPLTLATRRFFTCEPLGSIRSPGRSMAARGRASNPADDEAHYGCSRLQGLAVCGGCTIRSFLRGSFGDLRRGSKQPGQHGAALARAPESGNRRA